MLSMSKLTLAITLICSVSTAQEMKEPDIDFGPAQLRSWKMQRSTARNRAFPKRDAFSGWRVGKDGKLQTSTLRSSVFFSLKLPDRFEVEVVLTSQTSQPCFILGFAETTSDTTTRFETWDKTLVALSGDSFQDLAEMKNGQRQLTVRAFCDRTTNELLMPVASGRVFKLKTNLKPKQLTGLKLDNRGVELAIEKIRVRAWDGDLKKVKQTASEMKKAAAKKHQLEKSK